MEAKNNEPMTKPEFETLQRKFDKMQADVKEVKDALLGNEYNKDGIIKTIDDHETRITAMENIWKNMKWLLVGLAGAGGMGITSFITRIIEILHNNH